jgi:NDP-sugar pyrophosphorylase family protein
VSSEMLPVAILAGGPATRLRPISDAIPKALIDIHGEPFIAYQLRLLHTQGIQRVVLCVGHLGHKIVDVIGDGAAFGVRVTYSFDGPRLLGTAGAIKRALPQLGEAFFVLYGDSYLECDYQEIRVAFEACGKMALMTVYRNQGRWDKSNVELVDGEILAYDKRRQTPQMLHIDYGLGVLRDTALAMVPGGETFDLEAVYQDLLARGELAPFEVPRRFYEVGSLDGLEETRHHLGRRGTCGDAIRTKTPE